MDQPLQCSVVLTTRNRSGTLAGALDALVAQDAPSGVFEVIVVDNGSTDDTHQVVESYSSRFSQVHYVYEAVPGPASGRNAGIARARGTLLAFTDDDVRVAGNWVTTIAETFAAHADVDACAGRILPDWRGAPPDWLTREHWVGPLALQDYGDQPFWVDASRPLAIAAANLAIRASVLASIGPFSLALKRAEDTELLVRLWRAGGRCMYVPGMVAIAEIQPERLTKAYHRWWHGANGEWTSAMHLAEAIDRDGRLLDRPLEGPTLYGVPAFVCRELLRVSRRWALASTLRRRGEALKHEYRLRYLSGYIRRRYNVYVASRHPKLGQEIGRFVVALWRRKSGRDAPHAGRESSRETTPAVEGTHQPPHGPARAG